MLRSTKRRSSSTKTWSLRHEIKRDLSTKDEHANTFPGKTNEEDSIVAIRAEDFADFLQAGAIGQRVNATQRVGKRGTLKRVHELEHRVASPLLPVMPNLRGGENHPGRDGDALIRFVRVERSTLRVC